MAAMYELSRTPTPGMFLRNRSNAVSVRARRRKVLDQNGNDVENTENTMPKTPNQSVSAFAKKEVGYYSSSSDKKRKKYSLGRRKFRFDFWTLLILWNSFFFLSIEDVITDILTNTMNLFNYIPNLKNTSPQIGKLGMKNMP